MSIIEFDDIFVQSLCQHDEDAFALFYHQTSDHFFRYIVTHYTISDADAQDILSDVYLKIWNGVSAYDHSYTFGQYVWTILKNHCKDYCKKIKPILFSDMMKSHTDDSSVDYSHLLLDESASSDVAATMDQNFALSSIHQAIISFDVEDQQLLHERFVLGYSYDDLASLYNHNPDTIRQKISRLVKKMRGLLAHTHDV
ncbi:sigma-70 family RNA polymerase sigma factor [Patescibacteria group bacterium]|nr:sigma-70 family RNA polymerase sigma factor [Patescibacteria group bacterium]